MSAGGSMSAVAAASAASRMATALGALPRSRSSAVLAHTGPSPTLSSVTEARVHVPPASSEMTAHTPTRAKSPCRRETSSNAQPVRSGRAGYVECLVTELVRGQRCAEKPGAEIAEGHCTIAARAAQVELRLEGQHHGRKLRGRVGVGQASCRPCPGSGSADGRSTAWPRPAEARSAAPLHCARRPSAGSWPRFADRCPSRGCRAVPPTGRGLPALPAARDGSSSPE